MRGEGIYLGKSAGSPSGKIAGLKTTVRDKIGRERRSCKCQYYCCQPDKERRLHQGMLTGYRVRKKIEARLTK